MRGHPHHELPREIASPHPLPFPTREFPDVFLLQRTIKSLEQENAWLKERLAQLDDAGTSPEPLNTDSTHFF
jgi:hypothetical protein